MSKGKKGVLLINLGTPDSPSTRGVRKYLKEFFSDARVIDTSDTTRFLLRNLIILPFRSPKSAALYKEIWTERGSPLLFHSLDLKEKVQQQLGDDYMVVLGMAYGNPGLQPAIDKLLKAQVSSIKVLPLFPQYASATVGSVTEGTMKHLSTKEVIPPVSFSEHYYNHPAFINAWEEQAKKYNLNECDHILFSYHGLPERQIEKADDCNHCLKDNCCETISTKNQFCYRAQCFATTKALVEKLKIKKEDYTITFQSRLGKTPWIKPYTDDVLIKLAKEGKKKVLVFAPAFVADCLETIHEISIEYNELFQENGGDNLQLVECLNSNDAWVNCVSELVKS